MPTPLHTITALAAPLVAPRSASALLCTQRHIVLAVLVDHCEPGASLRLSVPAPMMASSEQSLGSAARSSAAVDGGPPPGPTDMIGLHIPDIVVRDAVVYYLVTVVTPAKAWSCQKRYSQFEELHLHLTTQFPHLTLPAGCQLPSKRPKALVSHTDRHFIEERRLLLEYYSRRMNTVKDIASCTTFKGFFASDQLDHLVHVPDDVPTFPPDAEITSVAIPYTRRMSDHVLYHVELCNAHMRKSFSEWSILKRVSGRDQHMQGGGRHSRCVLTGGAGVCCAGVVCSTCSSTS